jgi:hypothetical protein
MSVQKIAPLFTTKFSQGRRTFFFDVKKSKNEKPYLRITASSVRGDERSRSYLTIFDNEVHDFQQAIADATSFIVNA